jgi:demethylmenaquinone methyltransferase/2-methoxy-6-polyprenyl-1,4-benzoquinol methylase
VPVARSTFVRQPPTRVVSRYDRLARWYRLAELPLALPYGLRRKAVRRLGLQSANTVLEIGCGSGRNLPLLCEAVGGDGVVIGVDASEGMLAQARRLVARHALENVRLSCQDASELALDDRLDPALFSLSYSVLSDREPVLYKTWEALRPGGRLVVMDAGLPDTRLGRLLSPIGEAIATVLPGDPYSRPWDDLRALSENVDSERFQFGTYFICAISKP